MGKGKSINITMVTARSSGDAQTVSPRDYHFNNRGSNSEQAIEIKKQRQSVGDPVIKRSSDEYDQNDDEACSENFSSGGASHEAKEVGGVPGMTTPTGIKVEVRNSNIFGPNNV